MSKTSEMIASFHEMKCACGFRTRNRVKGQPASHFLTAHAHSARVARYRQTGTLTGCPVNAQQKHKFLAPCGARDVYSGGVSPGM